MTSTNEKIRDHLTQQKARAMGGSQGTSCRYRGDNGTMCAVGCLIPDELYHPHMEGSGVTRIVDNDWCSEEGYAPFPIPADIDIKTLIDWQGYHDSSVILPGPPAQYFRYQSWIDGDEAHSPTAFMEALENAKSQSA